MSTVQRRDQPHITSEILDRQPPCNIEAEQNVLGSIFVLPVICDEMALILRAEDFYDDANAKIFSHMLAMHDDGRKIDVDLLVDRMNTHKDLEQVGGISYLGKIINRVPNAAHAEYYAEIVRNKATIRSLIYASTDILRDAYGETTNSREMLSHAEEKIFSILDSRGTTTVSTIRDVLHEAMDRIDARMQGDQATGGVETGFTDLDHLTGGLHNSEFIVLAARPSMGKTALAMNIAENVAMKFRSPVFFASLEMSAIEMADRMLCSIARVDGHRLRNGTLSREDRQQLVEKAAVVSEAPLFIDDSPRRTITEIAAAARRIKRRDGLGLIIIDYLQLVEPDNLRDPRQEQVAKMARRIKGMARELEVPILCIAQLNRQTEDSKSSKRPRLNHLRESGAIEQDADVVMFIHREEYYHSGEEREQYAGQAEVIIAKQRNGPVGDANLLWQSKFTRFENLEQRERFQDLDDFNEKGF